MSMEKEFKKNFADAWSNLKENIYFAFSFENKISCWPFVILVLFINAIFSSFHFFGALQKFTFVAELVEFYAILALIQKRCRDFGSKGTFWILAYSVAFVVYQAFHFVDINSVAKVWRNVYVGALDIQVATLLLLFFIPSKAEADLSLRSPLLKYPPLYICLCWALAIGATVAIDHFADI